MATFQTHFFRLSGNKIEMNFCQNLCISIDESLVVLCNSFIPPHSFWVKNAKINFLQKRGIECSFYRIEVRMVTNMSNQHEKKIEMLLRADFLRIF